jgi:hypothetical protein
MHQRREPAESWQAAASAQPDSRESMHPGEPARARHHLSALGEKPNTSGRIAIEKRNASFCKREISYLRFDRNTALMS